MATLSLLLLLAVLAGAGFHLGRRRALAVAGGAARALHSRPHHYGLLVALWCAVPSLIVTALWLVLQPAVTERLAVATLPTELLTLPADRLGLIVNDIETVAAGGFRRGEIDPAIRTAAAQWRHANRIGTAAMWVVALAIALVGLIWSRARIRPGLRARNAIERAIAAALLISSTVAVLTTVGIVLSLLFETLRFFDSVPLTEFLFGLHWSPQTAIREDQVGASGAFGAVPLFAGTLLITVIAMAVAVPIGLMAAIHLSEYAAPSVRAAVKPTLEILAGVPTVAYGFFAAITVAPALRELGERLGLSVASESALAAGLVMGIMIIPFISSLSDDIINAVPQALRDGSFALGATKSETVKRVVLPAALPGIVGATLLGVSRAIGETMIVVMAAGLAANLTANPFEAVTTVTVQIVTLLVGDQEFDSPKTLAAFALGLALFVATLALNIVALGVVRRYREKYD